MTGFTYADVYEQVAGAQPERPAVVQGDRTITWGQFDARADALAADFLAAGLQHQSKVAAYLYNAPEYLETYYAAFKAGLAPFNVNYRYGADELLYLLDNADAEAVVFHSSFADVLDPLRSRLPLVKRYVAVAEAGYPVPDWAVDYEAVTAKAPAARPVKAPWGRSGDDILMLYTGGTTGMPKGVMWRQDELFCALGQGGNLLTGLAPIESVDEIPERLKDETNYRPVGMAASPLMHGTGQFGSLSSLTLGGTVSLLPSRKFSAEELWTEVERHKTTRIGIVGLAFSTPMLDALDANPGKWDLSSVRFIGSSGSMWSHENKKGLLEHLPPGCILSDAFSSSEALGMGASQSAQGAEAQTAKFALGPNAAVFTEDGRRVEPGTEERGMVAVGGRLPEGYYKDPEKTAKTFPPAGRPPLVHAGRLGDGEPRRHAQSPRSRLGVHQHRRREGLPRGGGGVAEAPRLGSRRGRGGSARSPLRRAHLRRDRAGSGRGRARPRRNRRPREKPARRLQVAPQSRGGGQRRSRAQRQGGLQGRQGAGHGPVGRRRLRA